MMISGYVTLGTRDLAKAALFYDAIAAELDTLRMMEFDGFIVEVVGGGAGILSRSGLLDGNLVMLAHGGWSRFRRRTATGDAGHEIALTNGGIMKVRSGSAAKAFTRVISAISTATSLTLLRDG